MNDYRQVIVRTFDADLTGDEDGRLIRGVCVPYGEVAEVDDGHGAYREMFVRGAFRRATRAPRKVMLDFEHQTTILDVLGHGVEFDERDDGLHGVFEATGVQGERALELVRDRVLTGMSVRATVLGPGRRDGDVTVRTACHLDRVALCRTPAYAGAVVAALRSAAPAAEPAELAQLRPARNPDLDDRLRALGIVATANTEGVTSGS